MSRPDKLTFTLRLSDKDLLRLVAYREVLREIAKDRWSEAGAMAGRVLDHFEDRP